MIPRSEAFRRWLEGSRKKEVTRVQAGAVPKVEKVNEHGAESLNRSDSSGAETGGS